MFFGRAVDQLRRTGHEVLCTSRKYREAEELARIKKLDLKIVGTHGGADRYGKLRASASRTFDLADTVQEFGPDVALTFSSPEGARVAFGLGMPHFAFNDSPHSEAVARLTIPLASRLYCPWVIPASAWTKYGVPKGAITRYRALDPAAWLKHEPRRSRPENADRDIIIRLEESKASYMADKGMGTGDLIDHFVEAYHSSHNISILCRYQDQIEAAEARYSSRAKVMRDVVEGTTVLQAASLFIGAGGTMTAEAALLGIPTISITPFTFYVEKFLVRAGLVRKAATPNALVKLARTMLSSKGYQRALRKKAESVLGKMEDPTDRMIEAVNSVRL